MPDAREAAVEAMAAALPRTCSIEGCDLPHIARGWCHAHYSRWRRNGDPLLCAEGPRPVANKPVSRVERFWQLVEKTDGCWYWKASLDLGSYGRFWWNGEVIGAHRVSYVLAFGDIPSGCEVDHVCHNTDLSCPGGPCLHRRCVNPAHLEAVPQAVNASRAYSRRPCCGRGHLWTPESTIYRADGFRQCRICRNLKMRERKRAERARKKAGNAKP